MALSLSDLKQVSKSGPARFLIHGVPKVGKTTLASEFPNPVFIQTEDGENDTEITTFGKLESLTQVHEALGALFNEDHGFQTVVIDSVTALQRLVKEAVLAERPTNEKGKPVKSLNDYGFGAGYGYVTQKFDEIWQALEWLNKERGMYVVMIGHTVIKSVEPPDGEPYARYQIDLDKQVEALLQRETDVIAFLDTARNVRESEDGGGFGKKHKYVSGSGSYVMIKMDRGNPSYAGGSRIGMPAEIRYDKGKGFEVLSQYFPGQNQTNETQPALVEAAEIEKDAA